MRTTSCPAVYVCIVHIYIYIHVPVHIPDVYTTGTQLRVADGRVHSHTLLLLSSRPTSSVRTASRVRTFRNQTETYSDLTTGLRLCREKIRSF